MDKRIKAFLLTAVISCGIVLMYSETTDTNPTTYPTLQERKKTLILMTQTRSGSSFAGQVFAATNHSLYLYEPLYPYGLKCEFQSERKALLEQLLECNFSNLNQSNAQGFKNSNWQDGAFCLRHGFCFTDKSTGLLRSYRKTCESTYPVSRKGAPKKCGYPLRAEILKSVCDGSKLLITKVTRVCTLEEMDNIYRHLKGGERDVYVVHLLRDLRSITSSLIKLALRKGNVSASGMGWIVNDVKKRRCNRQRGNLVYQTKDDKDFAMVADGRYMRIRYEDLSTNAIKETERIFKFMNLPLPVEVASNIINYLHPNKGVLKQIENGGELGKEVKELSKQYGNPFGVVRDPTKTLNEWRSLVPFGAVQEIQDKCGDVLNELGYAMFSNENEMKDLSIPSFITHPVIG